MPPEPATYVYKTVGECEIRADVYTSPDLSGPAAAIVHIHGGCLIYGSRKGINPGHLERYLQAGYAVVCIDYRLAPETRLPGIIADLRDAFRWVAGGAEDGPGLFSIDPERIAAVGHSAGGYLALMSGFCVTPRPKAIVSFYGYGDVAAKWYAKPDPFYCEQPAVSEAESGRNVRGPVISEPYEGRGKEKFYLYCRQNGLWPAEVGGRDPAAEPEFFTPYCPQRNVDADYPPTMLLHGDQDTDVPYEQSVLMAEELSRQGVRNELVTMSGRGHGFDHAMDDPEVRESFERALAFLAEHL